MEKKFLEKLGLAGLGLVSVSKEKVKKVIDELTKKGQIASKEGEKIMRQLGKRGEEELKFLERKIRAIIQEKGLATKKEVEKLREEIAKLKAKLK